MNSSFCVVVVVQEKHFSVISDSLDAFVGFCLYFEDGPPPVHLDYFCNEVDLTKFIANEALTQGSFVTVANKNFVHVYEYINIYCVYACTCIKMYTNEKHVHIYIYICIYVCMYSLLIRIN